MILISELILGFIVYFEYKNYKLIVTPVTVLGGVYFLFILLINTIGRLLGFNAITDKTALLFASFVLVLFVSGMVFSYIYNKTMINNMGQRYDINRKIVKHEKKIWIIYIISLLCYLISLVQVIQKYGIFNTKSHAFGLFAHIGFLSRCLLPIIVYYLFVTKKIRYLVSVMANILGLIMFQGKYHLYIPVAGTIILYFVVNSKINLKRIIKICIISFVVAYILFVNVYTIIPNLISGEISVDNMAKGIMFSSKHFFHYLFCPFICSNYFFSHPIYRTLEEGIRTNFNPLDTFWQQFFGNRSFFDPVITYWPVVDDLGTTANVGGLFSESVLNIGYPLSIVYVALIGSITYYFTMRCLLYGKRLVTFICISGTLMMSFFCNYFSLLPNIECIVYSYLVDVFILDNKFVFSRSKING